ncbi:hypothetical protein KAR28_06490 [Candidatus Parcubacteria bacterium]|nr:hypothetical protein [Candidatus Parcubacteria bacterium]
MVGKTFGRAPASLSASKASVQYGRSRDVARELNGFPAVNLHRRFISEAPEQGRDKSFGYFPGATSPKRG